MAIREIITGNQGTSKKRIGIIGWETKAGHAHHSIALK
jgi:hypothetical protein